jgi:viologen exporter family transport system permease protein
VADTTWTPYRAVLASRIRAQRSYPAGFTLDLMGSLLIGLTEFGEVWVIFHNVHALGGLDFDAILVLFGLSNLGFSMADLVVGHLDTLPTYIRAGTLDAFYLRPLPVLSQLMTSEIDLRRISRIVVALVALVFGLVVNDVPLDLHHAMLLVVAVVFGSAIFAGLFVCAASLQFFLINGAELTNAFTYGGSYASSQPASIFPSPLKMLFGYLVPVVFTAYLPTLALLDLPGPAGLPAWLAWLTPLAALWVWLAAFTLWRWGTAHYQGGGG